MDYTGSHNERNPRNLPCRQRPSDEPGYARPPDGDVHLFEAPLQMLADSPSKYMKEQECTDFIAKVPTVFDETVALDGEVGEYLTLARRRETSGTSPL